MSLQFSNTTTKNGILQNIEQICGFQDGGITGNTTLKAQFTGKVNNAVDDMTFLALTASGKWQFDDSNHTDYPFITTNLVLGQRDYTFTTDEQGNIILDIYRVMVKDEAGIYHAIEPVDQQSDAVMDGFYSGQNLTGIPSRYDKTGNGILLDAIPSYNSTNGLKMFVNRESSHFVVSDTTKMPGFKGTLHEYIPLKASYTYARDKRLSNFPDIARDILIMEAKIKKAYGEQSRDEQNVLTTTTINAI